MKFENTLYIGIDQSITSTGITFMKEGGEVILTTKVETEIDLIKFLKRTGQSIKLSRAFKEGLVDEKGKLISKKRKDLTKADKALLKVSQQDRFNFIIDKVNSTINDYLVINKYDRVIIALENISYGSAGQVSSLAMLLGRLYQSLQDRVIITPVITLVGPSMLKKFATGTGRADKDLMEASLPSNIKEKITSSEICLVTINEKSKIDDIIDSYFLASFALTHKEKIIEGDILS